MVRSRWIGAVAGVLTCLGPVAIAQQPPLKPEQVLTVTEAGKPGRKCKVLKVTRQKDGSTVRELEALDNGEKMTVVEPAGGKGGARVFKNVPTLSSLFGGGTKPKDTPAPPLADAPPVVAAETAPAKPGNWRESWGKVDRWTEDDSKKAADVASQRGAGRTSLPLATRETVEPLANPELFTKIGLPSAVTPLAPPTAPVVAAPPAAPLQAPVVSVPEPVVVPAPEAVVAPALTPRVSEAKPGPVRSWLSGLSFGAAAKETPAVEVPADPVPLTPPAPRHRMGAKSVSAATEELRPVKGKMPSMANAMSLPVTPAYEDPKGGANAFTAGTPGRPIPSDMGMPGGFGPPPGMMAAGMPPLPPQPLPPAMQQQMMMAAMAQQQQMAMHMAMAQQQQMAAAQHQAMLAAQAQQAAAVTPKLLAELRDSGLPSEREMAVDRLRHADWKAEPEVLQGLTEAARADPSPAVRLACVKALGQMKANTFPVLQTLEGLKSDRDPRVREESREVSEALTKKR